MSVGKILEEYEEKIEEAIEEVSRIKDPAWQSVVREVYLSCRDLSKSVRKELELLERKYARRK